MKIHFDEPPEGAGKSNSGRSVSQDIVLDLQCSINATLDILVNLMQQMAGSMERIEQAIIEGTEKAEEGIEASKENIRSLDNAANAVKDMVEELKRNGAT